MGQLGAKMGPKSAQNGSQEAPKFSTHFDLVLDPSWIRFGAQPQDGPQKAPETSSDEEARKA